VLRILRLPLHVHVLQGIFAHLVSFFCALPHVGLLSGTWVGLKSLDLFGGGLNTGRSPIPLSIRFML
jgi:hypothetical protein